MERGGLVVQLVRLVVLVVLIEAFLLAIQYLLSAEAWHRRDMGSTNLPYEGSTNNNPLPSSLCSPGKGLLYHQKRLANARRITFSSSEPS